MAAFGDGTIQIISNGNGTYDLVDLSNNVYKSLIQEVQSYQRSESGCTALVFGKGRFVVVNADTNIREVYDSLETVPDSLKDQFKQLQNRVDFH